jgi:hypothetical protein
MNDAERDGIGLALLRDGRLVQQKKTEAMLAAFFFSLSVTFPLKRIGKIRHDFIHGFPCHL